MLANAQTCAVIGLDGFIVQVEVDISPGLPAFKNVATQHHRQFGPTETSDAVTALDVRLPKQF